MADKTMTRAQALTLAIKALEDSNVPADVEAVEVLTKLHASLTKPRAKATGKTPARRENEQAIAKLLEVATDEPFASDFVMRITGAMTPQKVVGIMKVGISAGQFEKFKDGKRTMYRKL